MRFRQEAFEGGLTNRELVGLRLELRQSKRSGQLFDTVLAGERLLGRCNTLLGQQGGPYRVAGGIGAGTSLPHRQLSVARRVESYIRHRGERDGVLDGGARQA